MLKLRDISDGSLKKALKKALANDGELSDRDVIKLLLSTLDHDKISRDEVADLRHVRDNSTTISRRGKRYITQFIKCVDEFNTMMSRPATKVREVEKKIEDRVATFLLRQMRGAFIHLRRFEVGLGVLYNLRDPGRIHQRKATLCVPASHLFALAMDDPRRYAEFALDLYDHGKARVRQFNIDPYSDLLRYNPPRTGKNGMLAVDWMTMASIRNSKDGFFKWLRDLNYDDLASKGGTSFSESKEWMEEIGYHDIQMQPASGKYLNKDTPFQAKLAVAREANRLFRKGYRVFLAINARLVGKTSGEHSKHCVVLTSRIEGLGSSDPHDFVRFTVFTWGKGEKQVETTLADLLDNFLAFLAGVY